MVEQSEEDERDALVNNAGLKECIEGEGTSEDRGVNGSQTDEKQGEKQGGKREESCCGASLGTICCRGHRGNDKKGKYAVSYCVLSENLMSVVQMFSYSSNFLCCSINCASFRQEILTVRSL